jgi:hypothetical protein
VAHVELARAAAEDLEDLIRTHSLPADTRARVARSLRALERFPLLGPALSGRWEGLRFLLGPWRWLLLIYIFIEAEDRVVVVTIQDARSSTSATNHVGMAGFLAPAETSHASSEQGGTDGRLGLTVADVPAHVEERNGLPAIVTDEPMAPMSLAETRAAIERVRRRQELPYADLGVMRMLR